MKVADGKKKQLKTVIIADSLVVLKSIQNSSASSDEKIKTLRRRSHISLLGNAASAPLTIS